MFHFSTRWSSSAFFRDKPSLGRLSKSCLIRHLDAVPGCAGLESGDFRPTLFSQKKPRPLSRDAAFFAGDYFGTVFPANCLILLAGLIHSYGLMRPLPRLSSFAGLLCQREQTLCYSNALCHRFAYPNSLSSATHRSAH